MKYAFVSTALIFLACASEAPDAGVSKTEQTAPGLAVGAVAPTTRAWLFGVAFRVPLDCHLECALDVVPLSGSVHCSESTGLLDLSGTFNTGSLSLLEPTAPTVVGRTQVGSTLVYWGELPGQSTWCAIVSHPMLDPDTPTHWNFCTSSTDLKVRSHLRSIAQSVEDAPAAEQTPCSLF
jgi:hypothetical protein